MLRTFLLFSAFFGFTGVALGAFAAHGLKSRLSADYLAIFQTGVHYQMLHALALFGVALLSAHLGGRLVGIAGGFFVAGILIFSGSLYLLTLTSTPVKPKKAANSKKVRSMGKLPGGSSPYNDAHYRPGKPSHAHIVPPPVQVPRLFRPGQRLWSSSCAGYRRRAAC